MIRSTLVRSACLVAALAVAAPLAFAQAKLVVIASQKALLDTAELKKAQDDLRARFKPREDQIRKLETELADIQTRLQGGKLPAPTEQDLQIQGQRKQRELQRLSEDLQADVERERTDVLTRASQRMNDVIKKLADEKGYDVVVDASNVIFSKPAMDITAEATAAYNKAFPVAGAPAAPAAK
jgi:outer membrane protein